MKSFGLSHSTHSSCIFFKIMKNELIYINESLSHTICDAQKLALSFCDTMKPDIFGSFKVKRSELEKRIYDTVNAFAPLQKQITEAVEKTLLLRSSVLKSIETLYLEGREDEAKELSALLEKIEITQNVCIGISEGCISDYVGLLDSSMSYFSEKKEADINVSELNAYARAFFLRSEEYRRQLK